MLEVMRIEDFHVPNPPPGANELPSDDGEPMETQGHREQMNLLIDSLESAWQDRNDFYVGGNMFVYYSEPQAREAQEKEPPAFGGLMSSSCSTPIDTSGSHGSPGKRAASSPM
jgi:hypothetical protein